MTDDELKPFSHADVIGIFGLIHQLREAAHGTDYPGSKDCASCDTLTPVLSEWLGAHAKGADDDDD